uniref:Uncharacterized protein n=1 Tax=Oryza brachyantha TaxID=4533 RepID=J3N910_ORYBR
MEMVYSEILQTEDPVFVVNQIWKLAALCTTEEVDERPTMEQLAKHLGVLRRFWKKRRAEDVGASTGYCTEVEAAAAVGISGDEATEP